EKVYKNFESGWMCSLHDAAKAVFAQGKEDLILS
ncbi:MAG: hypothetical protein ACI9GZ_003703, partial [Bacteroidia bacterium]